jgi:enoyl-CoA hydratase/carnithine racemase
VEPKYVKVSYKGPIALITLNRPAYGNCVNAGLSMELKEACHQIERSERIRAVVVTGAGNVFSSGRQTFISPNNNKMSASLEASLEDLRCSNALSDLTMPTIAAINGNTIDHGLELALACDLRIAVSDARMGFRDLGLGIVPWDGGTQRLARLIGKARL